MTLSHAILKKWVLSKTLSELFGARALVLRFTVIMLTNIITDPVYSHRRRVQTLRAFHNENQFSRLFCDLIGQFLQLN